MTKKLKDLLVDSVVVIDAHENSYWEALCNAYRVFLPGTVIEDELFFLHLTKVKNRCWYLIGSIREKSPVSMQKSPISLS